MKNLIFLTILVLCFSNNSMFSSANRKDSTKCLVIRGRILNSAENIFDQCKIELINSEGVLDSVFLKNGSKTFKFTLHRNSNYKIRVVKKGCVPKLISIDTKVPANNDNVYDFNFNIGLMTIDEGNRLNKEALDLPIAIIYFNERQEVFQYNREYTAKIKREIYNRSERNMVTTSE